MNVIPQVVKDGFVRLTGPAVRALIRVGVTPNAITTVGALVVVGSAVSFGVGAIRLGGALLLASGVLDILDGQVAKQGGLSTTFGAFYDSSLDRIGESALFAGIALHFLRGGLLPGHIVWGVMLAIAALASSLMVSYTRARAEGLGLDNKVGIAARAERIVVLGAPTVLFGAGRDGKLLFWIVAVLALATTITVIQRIVHVARLVGAAPKKPASRRRDTLPGHAPLRKGT
jgi:CDP-diacylglycerol--glycerol-3-phosphate 3-phosphatidyltransferase